jgi:hypothetical protein
MGVLRSRKCQCMMRESCKDLIRVR